MRVTFTQGDVRYRLDVEKFVITDEGMLGDEVEITSKDLVLADSLLVEQWRRDEATGVELVRVEYGIEE